MRVLLAIPILAAMLGTVWGGHAYIAQRLVSDPEWSVTATRLGLGLVCLGALSLFLQPIGERTLPRRFARLIAWPASIWMGLFFYSFWGLLASDLVFALAGFVDPEGASDGLRGPRGRAALVAAGTLAVVAIATRKGLSPPGLVRFELELERWPLALDGFRIAQISDIHIGPILDRRFARRITERVNALEADLIAVTGDVVDGRLELLREEVEPFSALRARYGTCFVTGNHDHMSGAGGWSERMAELGMRVLRNERITIEAAPGGSGRFELAGVDDHRSRYMPGEGGEDLDAALADLPGDRPCLLLAHDPGSFKRASAMGIDLQLSGHTHGGQIWPFEYLVRLATPFVSGLHRRGSALLYVSRGTGFWGPPMRLGAPAEITEITLRSPARITQAEPEG
jgi:predicted MPP superfamily phosphohydrolase